MFPDDWEDPKDSHMGTGREYDNNHRKQGLSYLLALCALAIGIVLTLILLAQRACQ